MTRDFGQVDLARGTGWCLLKMFIAVYVAEVQSSICCRSSGQHMLKRCREVYVEEVQGSIRCRGSGKYMYRALALSLLNSRVKRGRSQYHLRSSVSQVVLRKPTPTQIRQLCFYHYRYNPQVDEFVGELTFAKRFLKHFIRDEIPGTCRRRTPLRR